MDKKSAAVPYKPQLYQEVCVVKCCREKCEATLAKRHRRNIRKSSIEKKKRPTEERSSIRQSLRWVAMVLAVLALGASIFLAVSHNRDPRLTILVLLLAVLTGPLSIVFSLFSWLSSSLLAELPDTSKSTDSSQKDNDTNPSHYSGKCTISNGDPIILQGHFAAGKSIFLNMHFSNSQQEQVRHPLSTWFAERQGHQKLTRDFNGPIFLVDEQLPEPREFYGRKRAFSELLIRIRRQGSTSIVGPEHIGKTWLIEYLCQVAPTILPERIHIGYIDATLPACDTIAGFAREVLKAFGYGSLSEYESPNLVQMGKYVHSLQEEQLVVLCIDNFDALTQRKEFDRSFFEAIRAMAQIDLCLVVASKEPLIDLVSKSTHSSPFFNILNQIKLTSFQRDEALEFISDKGLRAGFTPDEQADLLKYAQDRAGQWPPLRLQLAGKLLLQDKRAGGRDLDSAYWQNFSRQLDKQYRQMIT